MAKYHIGFTGLLAARGVNCHQHTKISDDHLSFTNLLGARGDDCHRSYKKSKYHLGLAGFLVARDDNCDHHSIKISKYNLGYLFLDKVDALPSMEKVAKALDKVTFLMRLLMPME